jgi:hypothetical protein
MNPSDVRIANLILRQAVISIVSVDLSRLQKYGGLEWASTDDTKTLFQASFTQGGGDPITVTWELQERTPLAGLGDDNDNPWDPLPFRGYLYGCPWLPQPGRDIFLVPDAAIDVARLSKRPSTDLFTLRRPVYNRADLTDYQSYQRDRVWGTEVNASPPFVPRILGYECLGSSQTTLHAPPQLRDLDIPGARGRRTIRLVNLTASHGKNSFIISVEPNRCEEHGGLTWTTAESKTVLATVNKGPRLNVSHYPKQLRRLRGLIGYNNKPLQPSGVEQQVICCDWLPKPQANTFFLVSADAIHAARLAGRTTADLFTLGGATYDIDHMPAYMSWLRNEDGGQPHDHSDRCFNDVRLFGYRYLVSAADALREIPALVRKRPLNISDLL